MNILYVQYWDVIRAREDEYSSFVANKYNPGAKRVGLEIVGGYYVEAGIGPSTVACFTVNDLSAINSCVHNESFVNLNNELLNYVDNKRSLLAISTGRTGLEKYKIQEGVWKWNHYYTVKPEKKELYRTFIKKAVEVIGKIDFVELTEEWHILYGGTSDYLLEMSFKDPYDIARLMNNESFREMEKQLKKELIIDYSNRILRSTERFEKPRWITL